MSVNFKNLFILHIIAILCAMFNLSNIKIEFVADFVPLLDLMMIYHFAILRQGVFRIWFLFLLGLISDALIGLPLGITSLTYIICVKLFVGASERILRTHDFQNIFTQFIAFTLAVLIIKWLFLSIYYLKIYSLFGPLIQLASTLIFYIFIYRFFGYLDKKLIDA